MASEIPELEQSNSGIVVVHIWIRNRKGEDSLTGALREAKEEVGVDLLPETGQVVFSKVRGVIDGRYFGDIMDVWLFEYDGPVSLGNATTDEVAQTVWRNREQVRQLYDSGKLVDTLEYFFEKVDHGNCDYR